MHVHMYVCGRLREQFIFLFGVGKRGSGWVQLHLSLVIKKFRTAYSFIFSFAKILVFKFERNCSYVD